jgi:hypothetical protein
MAGHTEIARSVGLGIATAALSAAIAIAAYVTLLPLALSYDPVTRQPHEPSSFGPLILNLTPAVVTAGVCFIASGSRGAQDGLRIGTIAGVTLCAAWLGLELSRGRALTELIHWSYVLVIALLGVSGALASFARRRLSRAAESSG